MDGKTYGVREPAAARIVASPIQAKWCRNQSVIMEFDMTWFVVWQLSKWMTVGLCLRKDSVNHRLCNNIQLNELVKLEQFFFVVFCCRCLVFFDLDWLHLSLNQKLKSPFSYPWEKFGFRLRLCDWSASKIGSAYTSAARFTPFRFLLSSCV